MNKEAIEVLNRLTSRRDFRRDPDQLTQAFREDLSFLVSSLRSQIGSLQVDMHPSHTLVLDVKTTFAIFIQEEGSDEPLASCSIDSGTPGFLAARYEGRGGSSRRLNASLERPAPGILLWDLEESEQLVDSSDLASMLLGLLIRLATDVVGTELNATY